MAKEAIKTVPAKEIFQGKKKGKITDHIVIMGKAQNSDGKKLTIDTLSWEDLAKLTKNMSQKLCEYPSSFNYELAIIKVFLAHRGLDGDLLEFKQQLEWADDSIQPNGGR